jgi:macrolide transport system ATP-binding/permease protein
LTDRHAAVLLLADEPTGNLDARTSHEIMQTLTQLNREEGGTIVLVTHGPDIAAYADRTVTMRDGRILTDERKKSTVPAPPPTDLSIFHPHSPVEMASGAALSWAFGLMILAAAVQALARNEMRSALTMLGVLIGVAAKTCSASIATWAHQVVPEAGDGCARPVQRRRALAAF